MTLKYAFRRGNIIYYQRPVPKDLQDRYPGKLIKVSLGTGDIRAAADKITRLNREVEAEWSLMRGNPEATPKTIRGKAEEILGKFGLSPAPADNDPNARDLFYGHLDAKRERFAAGDEHAYRDNPADEYLSPAEIKAAQLLAGTIKPTLSDALELYLKVHPKRRDEKFAEDARRTIKTLTDAVGDKPMDDLTRVDAHAYVAAEQKRGVKTGTIDRYMNTIRAVIGTWLREKEIDRTNPFTRIPIPANGEDAKKREPFTEGEFKNLLAACRTKDDDVRWLIAILADTGARMAEITGLAMSDLVLDAEVPHIIIQPHPWRTLKNDSSARTVPLVGAALWAAQRVTERATKGQRFAFPRYTDAEGTKATHASNTIAKWIRGLKIDGKAMDHTAHDLRHTMADRLREVGCPPEIRLAIGGWAIAGIGATYGKGYTLRVMAEWLHKVAI
ncbi:phage integrase [Ralstonia pseudosolanacearum]|uniref:phage integrase n=1 Tax=Ralstonia pseudosolanacearum TaxID=1310165 RepID=UPI002676CC0F|nr:tyrosine-type recombinase/integrase [Ralstonia pseudosolanacearum]MDO3579300.1 tyrosine-type recombinase/integrase [Ralstonia pseudosolanacearum]MDO3589145.1 tyrosine-type recombinase/integrase [Ralstonia pseudosolanacearum]